MVGSGLQAGWLACARHSRRPVIVSRNWLALAGGATIRPAKLQISKCQKYRRLDSMIDIAHAPTAGSSVLT